MRALPQRAINPGASSAPTPFDGASSPPSLSQIQAQRNSSSSPFTGLGGSSSAFAAALAAANEASASSTREGSSAPTPAPTRPVGRPSQSQVAASSPQSSTVGAAASFSSSTSALSRSSLTETQTATSPSSDSGSFQIQRPRGREGAAATVPTPVTLMERDREESGSPFVAAGGSSSPVIAASPSSAASLTAALDLGTGGSTKTFATTLLHNFVGVSSQVEIGAYAVKRCASFLKKLSFAQEEYSRTISKLLAHEQTKLSKLTTDHMGLQQKSWVALQDIYAKVAKSHLMEASEIQNQMVAPLHEFYLAAEESRKGILLEERKISGEMTRAREDVAKSLRETTKLIDEAKKMTQDASTASSSSDSGKSFFKTLSMKVGRRPGEWRKKLPDCISSEHRLRSL